MPATDFKDYYQILGVSKTADESEIKRTFRKLARQYHPDMNPGDQAAEAKFKEISEAYEVLSDASKRQKYDQFGQYWNQTGGGPSGADPFGGQYGSFDEFINELLGRFGGFGGAGGATGYRTTTATPGFGFNDAGFGFNDGSFGNAGKMSADATAEISLSFDEALQGVQKRLIIGGSETVSVRIPAGAKPGTKIRVRGKGQLNPMTQTRGDLYLTVNVQPHSFFKFDGDQLTCELPITPDEAALGASVDVPTPKGTVKMNIPAGIKSGQSLRLKGKGWPLAKGGHTDQLVKIQIVMPKELSDAERECYQKLAQLRSFNPRSHL
jgi:curved DNA-binding protein